MFRYICMPKLVAFLLREFSGRSDSSMSTLYKFVFCLCLPLVSQTFRRARLIALAIAECTNSADQISRLITAITGATMVVNPYIGETYISYDDTSPLQTPYSYPPTGDPLIPYTPMANAGEIIITLNGASQSEVQAYLELLLPFYVTYTLKFK